VLSHYLQKKYPIVISKNQTAFSPHAVTLVVNTLIIMKKKSLQYAALIFMIMGLIGIISETGPVWTRYTLLSLGILFVLFTLNKGPKD
jgi:hypothetical protein